MKVLVSIIVVAAVLGGCALPGGSGVTVRYQSSVDGSPARAAARSTSLLRASQVAAGIEFDSFKLSIEEVAFKVDENDPDNPNDVYFIGPYVLDLLDSTGPLAQTIGNTIVPPGNYEELRFKLHKTIAPTTITELFDRSIFLSGTINGTPFEMWHDAGENLDVGKATGIVVDDGPLVVTVDFQLTSFLDQAAAGGVLIDLTTATDGNGNGIIEINPVSGDGAVNINLAEDLKDNIKLVADLL